MALRYDIGSLQKPRRTDEGYLIADAYLTRPGVFPYRQADGSVRLELRPRQEVFDEDSLATLFAKPTCLHHPVDADGEPIFINTKNHKQYATGAIAGGVWRDALADCVRGTLAIQRQDHIDAIERDKLVEQSCGYECEIDETSGDDPEFGPYDVIQRRIRYNHTATVPHGRMGPKVKLRADAAMQLPARTPTSNTTPKKEAPVMAQYTVGSSTFDVDDKFTPVLTAIRQEAENKVREMQARLDKAEPPKTKSGEKGDGEGKADMQKLMDENAKLKEELAALKGKKKKEGDDDGKTPPKKADQMDLYATRRKRERLAGQLKIDKYEELDDRALDLAIVKELGEEVDAETVSQDYLDAMIDFASRQSKHDGADPPRGGMLDRLGSQRQTRGDAGDGRDAMLSQLEKLRRKD